MNDEEIQNKNTINVATDHIKAIMCRLTLHEKCINPNQL